jgi:L-iditol 2-dehydrogenase
MEKMAKAAILQKVGGPFEICSYEIPEPGNDTFVIKVESAGICGTDAHIYHGRLPGIEFPLLLGHEITGVIHALGSGVKCDYLNQEVKIGDRVILMPNVSCGICHTCAVLKMPGRCAKKKPSYGFKSPASTEPHLSGGYAEYMHVFNAGTVFFKTDLKPKVSVLLEPLTIALHAVNRGQIKVGHSVVVQGTGAIGLMAIMCAKLAGASPIVAIGGPEERLNLAKRFGADYIIDISVASTFEDRLALVQKYVDSNIGASVVLECAGVPSAFLEGISFTGDSGILCEVGHFTDNGTVDFNPYFHLLKRNITLHGVFGAGGVETWCRSLAILHRPNFPFDEVVSHEISLGEIEKAIQSMSGSYKLDGKDAIKVVINPWK